MNKIKIKVKDQYVNSLTDFANSLYKDFQNTGTSIYKGRNELKHFKVADYDLIVKQYKIPIFINRIIYSFFRKSKARRSYEYAGHLLENGIGTAFPVGYVEIYSNGLFHQGYFISEKVPYDRIFREFADGEINGRENILEAFAKFTADLHEKGILHLDYSPGNILFEIKDDKINFTLLDLNRMKFCKISPKKGLENLERITYSNEILCYMASCYAKYRCYDKEKAIKIALEAKSNFHKKATKKNKLKHLFRS